MKSWLMNPPYSIKTYIYRILWNPTYETLWNSTQWIPTVYHPRNHMKSYPIKPCLINCYPTLLDPACSTLHQEKCPTLRNLTYTILPYEILPHGTRPYEAPQGTLPYETLPKTMPFETPAFETLYPMKLYLWDPTLWNPTILDPTVWISTYKTLPMRPYTMKPYTLRNPIYETLSYLWDSTL